MLSSRMMHMLWGLREREYIKTIFGKFIDKKLAEKILSDKDITKGKKKNVTILYIDMRDFTKFTEENSPEEVVSTLNEFFTIAVNSIKNYGGIIDKFIGDAILALFGAIEEAGDEPEKAVSAAKEFINKLEEFNKKRAQQSKPEIKVGVTIHIGEVIVGNIGSEEKQEFTVVGDAVNTASRMQLYNRQFNLPLLISKEIAERLDKNKFKTKFISSVSIRGKKSTVDLYTVED
jgi:adenylate cyclase